MHTLFAESLSVAEINNVHLPFLPQDIYSSLNLPQFFHVFSLRPKAKSLMGKK
jgi:hypothetical protein